MHVFRRFTCLLTGKTGRWLTKRRITPFRSTESSTFTAHVKLRKRKQTVQANRASNKSFSINGVDGDSQLNVCGLGLCRIFVSLPLGRYGLKPALSNETRCRSTCSSARSISFATGVYFSDKVGFTYDHAQVPARHHLPIERA